MLVHIGFLIWFIDYGYKKALIANGQSNKGFSYDSN